MTVATVPRNNTPQVYYGLSSDTKAVFAPTGVGSNTGSLFYELDTGRVYVWDGAAWTRWYTTQLGARLPAYGIMIPSQVHVAAAATIHWDLFNADAANLIRVLSILQIPNITTAVAGVVTDWILKRTTAVGTGGVAQTPYLSDSAQAAVAAGVTCRSKPTGGATAGTVLSNYSISSEETDAGAIQVATRGGLELVPPGLQLIGGGTGLVLRQNEGVSVTQATNSSAGNTGWLISFSQEKL